MSRTMINSLIAVASLAVAMVIAGPVKAGIVFADFNTDEGPFTSLPTDSAQTSFATTSTADRTTTDSIEGGGSERLDLVDGVTASNRLRFLAGGGDPTNPLNTPFTTSAGTDGFIGYFYKVVGTLANAASTTMSINLDGPGGTVAEMDGSVPKAVIADGTWHFVEWNLDLPSDWTPISGIGGGHGASGVPHGSHTVDSIYFQNNQAPPNSHFEILIDFVAKSDGESLGAFVPEPATLAMLMALLGTCAIARTRRA